MKNKQKIPLTRPKCMATELAGKFGVTTAYVYQIAYGRRRCLRGKALEIRKYLESIQK